MPEAIYGPGKEPSTVAAVVAELLAGGTGPVLATRVNDEQAEAALSVAPNGTRIGSTLIWRAAARRSERVVVVSAGSSDQPVTDECVATLRAYGFAPTVITDVGVAGIHRLLAHVEPIAEADAVVAIAGMEGALASVVTGLASGPVVAVPTSVGYGAGLEGVTALLSMLASCASGLTVVGIDNGFGAGSAIARMLRINAGVDA
jgi:NCAIR mutase (PurE)-related protein